MVVAGQAQAGGNGQAGGKAEDDVSPVVLKAEETAARLQPVGPYFGCSSSGAPPAHLHLPGSSSQYCSRAQTSTPGGNVTDICRYDCVGVLGGSGTCNATDALSKPKAVDCEPVGGCVQAYFDEACVGGARAPAGQTNRVILLEPDQTFTTTFLYHGLNFTGTGTGLFVRVDQTFAPGSVSTQPAALLYQYLTTTPGSIIIRAQSAVLFQGIFAGQGGSVSAPAVSIKGSLDGSPVEGCNSKPPLTTDKPAARIDFKGCLADTLVITVVGSGKVGGGIGGDSFRTITIDTMDVCPAVQPSDLIASAGGLACPPVPTP